VLRGIQNIRRRRWNRYQDLAVGYRVSQDYRYVAIEAPDALAAGWAAAVWP